MMRRLFIFATLSFWLAVGGFATSGWWLPGEVHAPPPDRAARTYPLAEVARHGEAGDCWMAIDGQVYDLSGYLPDHPSDPEVIVAWCGREATQAYQTKGRGRAHSARADRLLAAYRIGALSAPR